MTPTIYANYGFRSGDNDCQSRIDKFIEEAILLPESAEFNEYARNALPPFVPLFRLSVWYCDENRRYFMTEPNGDPATTAACLNDWGVPWLRVPAQYGPYGNGATTFLFVSPENEHALQIVGKRLEVPLRAL